MSHSATIPSVAGIDVGKHFLDLGFFPAAKPVRKDSTETGITKLISTLKQRGIHKVALEAIGPYAYSGREGRYGLTRRKRRCRRGGRNRPGSRRPS